MLSNVIESTELRPLTPEEIDFVSGGQFTTVVRVTSATPNQPVTGNLLPPDTGTYTASASGSGVAEVLESSNGSIIAIAKVTGGSGSANVVVTGSSV